MKRDQAKTAAVSYPLATRTGIELLAGLLVARGALCSKCAFGTRAISKRWAVCKKCGKKVERRELPMIGKAGGRKFQ